MIIDDIAGVRPRLDDAVELWPIDVGYDHFAVNNLSYHGRDLTVVWDKPGDGRSTTGAPEGYSVYVDGERRVHRRRPRARELGRADRRVSVLDGSDTAVLFRARGGLRRGDRRRPVRQRPRRRHVPEGRRRPDARAGWLPNLAEGKPVTRLVHDHDAGAAGDGAGERGRRLHDQRPADPAGHATSPATRSGARRARRTPRTGSRSTSASRSASTRSSSTSTRTRRSAWAGNTYREPAVVHGPVPRRVGLGRRARQRESPAAPQPNYNRVDFPAVRRGAGASW